MTKKFKSILRFIFLENLWGVILGCWKKWDDLFWSSDQMFSIKAEQISTGII
jgi:hypothetical protein